MEHEHKALAKKVRKRPLAKGQCHDALEQVADRTFRGGAKTGHNLDLLVESAMVRRLTPDDALSELPDPCVSHLIRGPDEALGLTVLDGTMVDAIIELQTLGAIAKAPRVDRPVTKIDASLSESFLASIFTELELQLANISDGNSVKGFSVLRSELDKPALRLILTDKAYDILSVTLDLGPGIKTGKAQFWFPTRGALSLGEAHAQDPESQATMAEVLGESEVRLNVHLNPMKVPLATIISLEEGHCLALSADSLARARVRDEAGKQVAEGHLGQINGMRAVRISHMGNKSRSALGAMQTGVATAMLDTAVLPNLETNDQPDAMVDMETALASIPEPEAEPLEALEELPEVAMDLDFPAMDMDAGGEEELGDLPALDMDFGGGMAMDFEDLEN